MSSPHLAADPAPPHSVSAIEPVGPRADVIRAEARSFHSSLTPSPILKGRLRPGRDLLAATPHGAGTRVAIGAVCGVALVCLALAGREKIVARISVADRVFAAIGLPVNLAGVEFGNVVSKITEIDGQKVLAVTGDVINLRPSKPATLPSLKLTVRGADGRALYVWTANAPTSKLGPGETTTFRTRLAAPPEDARDVIVTLAEPAPRAAQADAAASVANGRLANK